MMHRRTSIVGSLSCASALALLACGSDGQSSPSDASVPVDSDTGAGPDAVPDGSSSEVWDPGCFVDEGCSIDRACSLDAPNVVRHFLTIICTEDFGPGCEGCQGSSCLEQPAEICAAGHLCDPRTAACAPAAEVVRPFRMGFQPWPYDLTQEAVDWTWEHITKDGDAYSIHLEEGVPWPESAAGEPFSENYQATLAAKKAAIAPDHAVLLSVNALDTSRSGLARYRGDAVAEPLPPPFDTAAFDSDLVKGAYLAYCKRMIDMFTPDWFVVGIEVNLLRRNRPDQWAAYLTLIEYVISALRETYPDLPVGASVFANSYVDTYQDAAESVADQRSALAELRPSLDFLALSVYPFMSQHLCESADRTAYFDALFELGGGLPVAVSESGYPAQEWSATVGDTTLQWNCTPEQQAEFVTQLLAAADERRAPFVIWFAIRDYDQLWEAIGRDATALVWRDTGLYDENGGRRPAHGVWTGALRRPRQ